MRGGRIGNRHNTKTKFRYFQSDTQAAEKPQYILDDMRIIYIHQYFNTPSSSSGTRSFEMARRLAARGHDVHIVTSSRKGHPEISETIENFTVHWLPAAYSQLMSYKDRLKAFFIFAVRASKVARRLSGDVVFATSTPLTVAIPGIVATMFSKRPLVFEVRDLWPDVPIALGALNNKLAQIFAHMLEKVTYRYSSHIVALSPDMRSAITSKGIDGKKVSVIPNAADNDLFGIHSDAGKIFRSQHEWLGDRKLVLYCGTLGRVNDVSYIARLAAATRELDETVRFLVVGKGNDLERVRETAQALGVYNENFFMMQPMPKTEVPALFSAADVSMSTVAPIPLLSANSANKVFDTFASGTPLAINHEGWLANLLRDTNAGLVLDSASPELASKQLLNFLDSPKAVQLAEKNSKMLGVEVFDRQKLAEQLAEILEHVENGLDNRHRRANTASIAERS